MVSTYNQSIIGPSTLFQLTFWRAMSPVRTSIEPFPTATRLKTQDVERKRLLCSTTDWSVRVSDTVAFGIEQQ